MKDVLNYGQRFSQIKWARHSVSALGGVFLGEAVSDMGAVKSASQAFDEKVASTIKALKESTRDLLEMLKVDKPQRKFTIKYNELMDKLKPEISRYEEGVRKMAPTIKKGVKSAAFTVHG